MAQDRAQRPTGGPTDGPPGGPHGGPQGSLPSIRGGTYFLGRYRVVDEIGIGGMASVHLARMDGPGGFQKWVAIKRIHPHLVEDDTFVHMFLDEARVAARISHPNVATVFELGKHEDTYWIAMEYLHGEPLREVMRRTEELGQPMPPEIACRVIADAAEGLHAAHELLGKNGEKLGLVHRDVTPHNLFVTYDGNTKVVDFGIAKFSSRMASTRAGTLKGKLAYMSPEQVQGEQIDRRTDIFALGVVLWELTTGQRLFRMESDLDTLAKVQECNVPRPSSIVRGYPIDLEKIVMKALAKNKNERFRTARELSRALQSLLMRRGLFVASDEVAAYTQAIFQDRIRKREAHLRWAAEVTQTINIENHVASVQSPSEHFARQEASASFASDVQPSPPAARGAVSAGVPRPAAGAPPPASTRPPPAHSTNRPGAMAQASTMSAQSAPTNPRPGALVETVRPPPKFQITAPPPALHTSPALAALDAAHPANEELNTIRASPQAMGGFADIEGDDFDDTDDTIVTTGRVEFADGIAHFPTPVPAAGRPAPARPGGDGPAQSYAPSRPPPMRPSQTPAPPLSIKPPYGGQHSSPPMRSTTPPPPPSISPGASQAPPVLQPADLGRLFDDIPAAPRPVFPTEVPGGATPYARTALPSEQKTELARTRVKATPTWMLACAAAFLGLMVVGLVFAVVSRSSTPSKPGAMPSVSSTLPGSRGPFGVARAAYNVATGAAKPPSPTQVAPPPSVNPPPPAPPPGSAAALPASPQATPSASAAQPPAALAAPTHVGATTPAAPTHAPPAPPPAPATAPVSGGTKKPATGTTDGTGDQGYLSVICLPACDQVLDNGKPMGPSPIFKRAVGVGEHRLKLIRLDPAVNKVVSAIVTASSEPSVVRQSMTP